MKIRLRLMALPALLTGALALPSSAIAHPEGCAKGEDHDDAYCFTQAQINAFDDSGARLGVDEVAFTRNVRPIANLPKTGPFAGEPNFGSDIAFQGDYAYQGNYNGFQVTNIRHPRKPFVVAQVHCPGSQNDISVFGDLLFTSTDSSRNKAECEGNEPQSATMASSWEGIRVFDISNPAAPRYVTAVETDCGSHTHTLLPDLANGRLLLYVSSYRPDPTFPDCQPPHDKISIVSVPLRQPGNASVIAEPVLFPNGGEPAKQFSDPPPDGRTSSETSGCHDITVFPAKGIAAGACMGEGVLMDISNPVAPRVTSTVTDRNFTFWHSASFTNDGRRVLFTDELGGGGGPTCNPTVGPRLGADAIYQVSGNRLSERPLGYFKIPRTQKNTENCVAHNGIFLPTKRSDVYVQAWYQGGTSLVDFNDPARAREIGFFERGPLSNERLIIGGAWSSYFYNGRVFVNDIQKGLDVLQLTGSAVATANSTKLQRLNAQTQDYVRR